MADPRAFDVPVAIAQEEALAAILGVVAGVPDAQQSFAERYDNPGLPGSPASLVEAARNDHMVRAEHGQAILLQAFATSSPTSSGASRSLRPGRGRRRARSGEQRR